MNDRGIVTVFQAEVPQIRVEIETARANDLDNDFLGMFGANHPWTQITTQSEPLRVTVPMSLQLEDGGGLRFQLLELRTNLANVDLTWASTARCCCLVSACSSTAIR